MTHFLLLIFSRCVCCCWQRRAPVRRTGERSLRAQARSAQQGRRGSALRKAIFHLFYLFCQVYVFVCGKEGKGSRARCCEPVPTRVAAVKLSESRLAPIRGITIIRIATGINTAYYCHADRKLKLGTPTASSLPLHTHTHTEVNTSRPEKDFEELFFLIIVQKWFF